jgi:predicted nucleotidyltransferase
MDISKLKIPQTPVVPGRMLFRAVLGSQAYGTATPESDVDIRGIFLPFKDYLLGFNKNVKQIEIGKPGKRGGKRLKFDAETVIFALHQFMRLAVKSNPNVLEILWAPDDCVLEINTEGELLRAHRADFLSRVAANSYTGYAFQQIHRIKLHRRWLFDPPKAPPLREDFGLPLGEKVVSREQMGAFYVTLAHMLRDVAEQRQLHKLVLEIVEDEAFPGWEGVVQKRGVPDLALPVVQKFTGATDNFIAALQKEQAYYRAVDEWSKYEDWKENRNPARAALERKFGMDTKHLGHLVRLMNSGVEILTTGKLVVRRPEAEQLLAVRNGVWIDGTPITPDRFDEFVAWAKSKELEMEALFRSDACPLPRKPNVNKLDDLCIELAEGIL